MKYLYFKPMAKVTMDLEEGVVDGTYSPWNKTW